MDNSSSSNASNRIPKRVLQVGVAVSLISQICLTVICYLHFLNSPTAVEREKQTAVTFLEQEPARRKTQNTISACPQNQSNVPTTSSSSSSSTGINSSYPVYGHIHVAKTAGTSLNVYMASTYTRVCGHKGYSFDFYQNNKRIPVDPETNEALQDQVRDSVYAIDQLERAEKKISGELTYFRGRVMFSVMDERGYEDCDWISNELPWYFWKRFSNWPIPLELHVPCREPLEHLMSQCNFQETEFDCHAKDLAYEIDRCTLYLDRYSDELQNLPNIDVKCFNNNVTFTKYLQYMKPPRLQLRRIPVRDPKPYATNRPRDLEKECIWKNKKLQEKVIAYLKEKYDYYSFCDQCLGSSQDLFG